MAKPNTAVFDAEYRRRASVVPVGRLQVAHMIRAHYLGKWPGVVVATLGLLIDGRPMGVIVFALPPRETEVRYGNPVWELARLWVDDSLPQNAETFFIARALKHLKRQHPKVRAVVSYADPSVGHEGTIYRAANFQQDGRTDEGRKTPRCDYVDPLSGKKYSRKKHIPPGLEVERVPRVSKARYVYWVRP